MTQEVGEKTDKPAEKDLQLQREKAESLLKASMLDDDGTSILPSLLSRPSQPGPSGVQFQGSSGSAPATGRPQAKQRAGGKKTSPIVLAAQHRAKTMKEFREVPRLLERSRRIAEDTLTKDALTVHDGSQEQVDADFTLNLLRSRIDLVTLAMDRAVSGPESLKMSKEFFNKCLEDPYLKDLSSTFLACESGCLTYGRVTYMRDTVMDLQSSADSVIEIATNVKNALGLLKKVATAVQAESDQWKANIAALHKAKKQEETATRTGTLQNILL